jgi:RNA polymerase sigma factor (TIGR02999 family)
MNPLSSSEITQILISWKQGNESALEQLVPLVQKELRRIAKHYMAGEKDGHLLQPTALVNEAYVRLIDWKNVEWKNRAHFFGMAAQIMRRVLVDFARAKGTQKRGGENLQVTLSAAEDVTPPRNADLVALDDALKRLAELNDRQAKVVEMRFFGGLNAKETAEALDISIATVRRDWSMAEAWLYRELKNG